MMRELGRTTCICLRRAASTSCAAEESLGIPLAPKVTTVQASGRVTRASIIWGAAVFLVRSGAPTTCYTRKFCHCTIHVRAAFPLATLNKKHTVTSRLKHGAPVQCKFVGRMGPMFRYLPRCLPTAKKWQTTMPSYPHPATLRFYNFKIPNGVTSKKWFSHKDLCKRSTNGSTNAFRTRPFRPRICVKTGTNGVRTRVRTHQNHNFETRIYVLIAHP